MKNLTPKKKKIIIISSAVVLLIAVLLLLWFLWGADIFMSRPTLTIETPPKHSLSDKQEISVDVSLSSLGEELYPASSVSITFDSSHLEFMGVEEGNVMVLSDEKADGDKTQLPEWSVDVEHSNETGQINVMYLDMTGGKYAFSKGLLEENNNVLLRLSFRLRGSARVGDVYELAFNDAVFAASDESRSLASVRQTLRTQNGRIVVGE